MLRLRQEVKFTLCCTTFYFFGLGFGAGLGLGVDFGVCLGLGGDCVGFGVGVDFGVELFIIYFLYIKLILNEYLDHSDTLLSFSLSLLYHFEY